MQTQCERGCNGEERDSAGVVRSIRSAARGGAVGSVYTVEMRGLGVALRCREGASQERPAWQGATRTEREVNGRIDAQETQAILQRPNRGAGLARGEDAARDGHRAAQVCQQADAERRRWMREGWDGGASAQGIGVLTSTTRGGGCADAETGVRSRLHGTGVAAHGRRVRQRGGREAGRKGGESAAARRIRDGYSDAGAERAQG
jgi:hypothetical protein